MIRTQLFSAKTILLIAFALFLFSSCEDDNGPKLQLKQGASIALIGNNLCSRMMNYGSFETEMHMRYPNEKLYIRNFCDGGDTPGFRPHSGRNNPWAFPGAEKFQTEYARKSGSEGHLQIHDEWLERHKADIVLAFFGYSESFQAEAGLANFMAELEAFMDHTMSQNYNGTSAPQLALVSPIAFQDLSDKYDFPNGKTENRNLKMYADVIKDIAEERGLVFIDAYTASKKWFASGDQLTIDGSQLNEEGYQKFAKLLSVRGFGKKKHSSDAKKAQILEAVNDKNWYWHNDWKIPNGVHVFGRRHEPFGPDNYPAELLKVREMTAIRDTAIWALNEGREYDRNAADAATTALPQVETNYKLEDQVKYLYGQELMNSFTVAPGYKLELFASEQDFPSLANPVQVSFDNKGRLWVAAMPTYPHYKPGDSKPNDKLIILEDTDNDGKADKETIFADDLHIPVGFEFAPEGVYVSQGTNLILLQDTDGDDKADKSEIMLSGFDDHDTHHVISAFCADPSGAIYMGEGVFLHTNVETSYGTVRATNGGFYRYDPIRHKLERTAQLSIPNPWGIAIDEWGQDFFAETSGPDFHWMMPGTMKPVYGVANHKSRNLIEADHRVRPTSGLEYVHSSHFPDEVQGNFLINNTIGFLGTKMHSLEDDGTGYKSIHVMDLVKSTDPNFRPVDMEFAPDGSLYLADWHNVLVGHMQHNARDPLRDHVHGKIYRITYPSRPLVSPVRIAGASIPELLDVLKVPEYRARYRARRELRSRNGNDVKNAIKSWVKGLSVTDGRYEHHVLEALWVTWGLNVIDRDLLNQCLVSDDHKVRAAAIKVLRHSGDQFEDKVDLLKKAAADEHGRVRMEAFNAASWLDQKDAMAVLAEAASHPLDDWMADAHKSALENVSRNFAENNNEEAAASMLTGADQASFIRGMEIYGREGYCSTCHQPDGKGLVAAAYPPLSGTRWVQGSEEKLIKLVLKGLHGPITINGKDYPGQVPMTAYEGLLTDEEIASVLTYIRNSFGNLSDAVMPETVKKVRAEVKDKKGFYSPVELEKMYPDR